MLVWDYKKMNPQLLKDCGLPHDTVMHGYVVGQITYSCTLMLYFLWDFTSWEAFFFQEVKEVYKIVLQGVPAHWNHSSL